MKVSRKVQTLMKILTGVLVAMMLLSSFSQVALAANTGANLAKFDQAGNTGNTENAVSNIIGAIIKIARVIGAGVAIIMLIVLAIQYIAASPEGKAEIKKNSTIYIVGAIILFAASAILGIIQNFATDNIGNG